jgi:hypothetical protein
MEAYIIAVRDHQHEFFEMDNTSAMFYKENLERNGNLTTFGTEITFCQFNCFLYRMLQKCYPFQKTHVDDL